jgi:hypothetical protein
MCLRSSWKPDVADRTARAVAATSIDVYEATIRAVTELEWLLARIAIFEPAGSLARAWADLTRDATAVQLSTVRWTLDL